MAGRKEKRRREEEEEERRKGNKVCCERSSLNSWVSMCVMVNMVQPVDCSLLVTTQLSLRNFSFRSLFPPARKLASAGHASVRRTTKKKKSGRDEIL